MGRSHKDSGWRNILTISANSGVFTISETCSQMLKVSSWCTLNLPSPPNSTPSQLSLLLKPGGLGWYGRHGTGSEESGCVPIMFFTHHSIFHQLFGIFLFSQEKSTQHNWNRLTYTLVSEKIYRRDINVNWRHTRWMLWCWKSLISTTKATASSVLLWFSNTMMINIQMSAINHQLIIFDWTNVKQNNCWQVNRTKIRMISKDSNVDRTELGRVKEGFKWLCKDLAREGNLWLEKCLQFLDGFQTMNKWRKYETGEM